MNLRFEISDFRKRTMELRFEISERKQKKESQISDFKSQILEGDKDEI
jgi:hypothetical protein